MFDAELPSTVLVALALAVDRDSHTITVGGVPIHTTPSEYEILAYMADRRGRLISREKLSDVLYGARPDCDAPASNVVDVMICNIRHKLAAAGAPALQRRWGQGYFLP
jgi:DNA-binding response OmpR family regulator